MLYSIVLHWPGFGEAAPARCPAEQGVAGRERRTRMKRYVLVVHSNPVAGREDEYNRWYRERHLDDLLQCPGVVSARRLLLADAQLPGREPPYKYLAIYEIETDKPQLALDTIAARAGGERMPTTTALAPGVSAVLWEELK
jgi:hypothetical protein